MRLFAGRQDAFGGEEGRANRLAPGEIIQVFTRHLAGIERAGIYPLVNQGGGWICRWGCVDFDIKSEGHAKYDYETEELAHTAALNLQKVLHAFGITAWIERTRSHGRHVWVFADAWVAAPTMREALLVACQIADVSQREVNPKSDGTNLTDEQLGNYVRLPYSDGPDRCILDEEGHPRNLLPWVEVAISHRTDRSTLERVAALYQPPLPTIEWEESKLDEYNGKVPRVVRHVIENGPNDGDRSKGLLYIAHECKKAGLSPRQALDLVMIADDSWGKYTGRRDREQRLIEIVERAWS
jgi:hypothetical protein